MDKEREGIKAVSAPIGSKIQSEFDFIKDKPHLVYLTKKLERLAGAIHIVTNTLSKEEPLRKAIREECLLLLQDVLIREKNPGSGTVIETGIAHCVSLIDVGRLSLLISEMNARVLRKEFIDLLPTVQGIYETERGRISFDASGLFVSDVPTKGLRNESFSKGHLERKDVLYEKVKRTPVISEHVGRIKSTKQMRGTGSSPDSTREKMILDIIKNKGEVSIKDITSLIRGVSGKTIQRDLIHLVSKNVLKKFGERRWSRYALNP